MHLRGSTGTCRTYSKTSGTAIAGVKGAVAPGVAERDIFRAVRSTLALEGAFAVGGAFERKAALMSEFPVGFDFLANSGLVLADGLWQFW